MYIRLSIRFIYVYVNVYMNTNIYIYIYIYIYICTYIIVSLLILYYIYIMCDHCFVCRVHVIVGLRDNLPCAAPFKSLQGLAVRFSFCSFLMSL